MKLSQTLPGWADRHRPAGRHQGGRKGPFGGTREAPARQERTNWTASEAPGRHQGFVHQGAVVSALLTEGGKDDLGSLGGSREAPGRHQRTSWTAWEAPGRQERTNWTACEVPGRHQGGRKGLIGQLARHQGGTREAGKEHLDSLGGTREAPEGLTSKPAS